MNDYRTPHSDEPTHVTNGWQTSMRFDEMQTPRHHADDSRHHDGIRGHPYYRPHAAHALDYNELDRYGYALAADENTRHVQAESDMVQAHTFEPRGYGSRPLVSREVLSEMRLREILDRDQQGFERQTTHLRWLNLVGENPTKFAPTYGSLTMRHNSTGIEHSASYRPPHVATTGYQT